MMLHTKEDVMKKYSNLMLNYINEGYVLMMDNSSYGGRKITNFLIKDDEILCLSIKYYYKNFDYDENLELCVELIDNMHTKNVKEILIYDKYEHVDDENDDLYVIIK